MLFIYNIHVQQFVIKIWNIKKRNSCTLTSLQTCDYINHTGNEVNTADYQLLLGTCRYGSSSLYPYNNSMLHFWPNMTKIEWLGTHANNWIFINIGFLAISKANIFDWGNSNQCNNIQCNQLACIVHILTSNWR